MPPPPPLSRALPPDKDDNGQSTFVRLVTGIIVTFAAAGLLLQLPWMGPPLPTDPAGMRETQRQASTVSRGGTNEATADEQGAPAAGVRSLRSMSQSALRLSRRTLSWLQTVSVGSQGVGSQGATGSSHSSSSDRTRATTGWSEPAGSQPESILEDVLEPGIDASGSMHALSPQDFAAVGVRSRHAARSPEAPQRTPPNAAPGRGVDERGSRHRTGTTAAHPPQRLPNLPRPRSCEVLPSRAAGPQLARRKDRVLGRCNMQGCPYRPRSLLAAVLHPTAEFHYCYR